MLAQANSPSAELYFAFSMEKEIQKGTARQVSPTAYFIDDTLVVARHLSGLRRLPKFKRLIYVIDDDWRAGIRDSTLPIGYRAKLVFREARQARFLERRADVILCSSDAVRERLKRRWPTKDVDILEPAWPLSQSSLAKKTPKHVAYLSAATHRADFEFLKPVLDFTLSEFSFHLTITANAPVPRSWVNHTNVTIVPVLDWHGYRDWMLSQEFDIGLYPACASQFNAMRSRNKLLEYDQFGAALLCSSAWSPGASAATENRCVVCSDRQSDWQQEIGRLLKTPGRANAIATANRAAITREDPLNSQRRHWLRILGRDSNQVNG